VNRIQRYLFFSLFRHTVFVFLGLSTLTWFAQLLKFTKGNGETLSFARKSLFACLHLVPVIYYTFPIALVLACVYRYTHLVQDRERDILYSSGMTPFRLMWPSFVMAWCLVGVLYSVSFWGGRTASLYLREHENTTKQILPHSLITPGVFLSLGNATLYIHSKDNAGVFSGILLHERKPKQTLVYSGRRGIFRQDVSGFSVTLYDGQCHAVSHAAHKAPYVMNFKSYTVHLYQKKKSTISQIKPQYLTCRALWRRIWSEDHKMPWVRELYLRCISPLWIPTVVLWVTWMILTRQSVRTRSYGRYALLSLGVILAQAIQLGSVYLGGVWGMIVQSVFIVPWILWAMLVLTVRRG
jgi:lipopolysaccharide export LptBFGC system permease protein LptF